MTENVFNKSKYKLKIFTSAQKVTWLNLNLIEGNTILFSLAYNLEVSWSFWPHFVITHQDGSHLQGGGGVYDGGRHAENPQGCGQCFRSSLCC